MRSLRARLTAGLTLLLAVVLLVFGTLAARDAARSDRDALDDRLQRTAELSRATAIVAVEQEVPSADDRLDAVLEATRTSLRLLIGDVALLDTGSAPRGRPKLPIGLTTYRAGGIRYRAFVTALPDPDLGGLARIEVTTPLTALDRRNRELRERLLGLGAASLLLGAVAIFLAGAVVLRPLSRLRATTASIASDDDLARRVPEDGPTETRALAGSFNGMLGRLSRSAADRERALAATRRFAADAGHEMRTPLTAVQASLSALARHPDLPAGRRGRMAEDALDQQRRLVALLDGLQALARGDAAPARTRVDLSEIVDGALAAASEAHPEVTWTANLPEAAVPLDGWEPGLRATVANLLENAARHGRPRGAVHVALAPGPPAELVVEDDGPGIPEADRARILEPFTRLGDTSASGSGLGLAVVAQQVEHHGAELAVGQSERLGGARFAIRFGR